MPVRKLPRSEIVAAAWAHAVRLDAFGYSEISRAMKIGHDAATRIVRSWAADGVLEPVQTGHRLRKLWRVRPGRRPVLPAPTRSAEQNMWTAMRGLQSFTPTDIAAHASTAAVAVESGVAAAYARALTAAGYLRVARKAAAGGREAIYRLVRNSGPRPPVERRVRAVVDGNTSAITLIAGGAE